MHNSVSIETIRKQKQFFNIKKKGNKIVYEPFIVLFTKNLNQSVQLGYIVSSKVGNAVVRNKVKRRLKNITMSILKETNLTHGFSICIIARTSAYTYNFDKMKGLLADAIEKIMA